MAEQHYEVCARGMMSQGLQRCRAQPGSPFPRPRFGKDQNHSRAAGIAPDELGPQRPLSVIGGTRGEGTSDIIVYYHRVERTGELGSRPSDHSV